MPTLRYALFAFVIAAAAGFVLGVALWREGHDAPRSTARPAQEAEGGDACSADTDALKHAVAKLQLALFAHATTACSDTADLTRTIATVEADLFKLEAKQKAWESTHPPPPPPPPPPELPPRYAPAVVEGAFEAALAEAHIDATVHPFFCPSLPCPVVVVPHVVLGDNAFMVFKNSPALAAFGDDNLSCSTVSIGSGKPVPRDAPASGGFSFSSYSLHCALVPHELRGSPLDAGVSE